MDYREEQVQEIANDLGLDLSVVRIKSRRRAILEQRQVMHYVLYKTGRFTLEDIGMFTNTDHATVIHSNKQVAAFLAMDKYFIHTYKAKILRAIEKHKVITREMPEPIKETNQKIVDFVDSYGKWNGGSKAQYLYTMLSELEKNKLIRVLV